MRTPLFIFAALALSLLAKPESNPGKQPHHPQLFQKHFLNRQSDELTFIHNGRPFIRLHTKFGQLYIDRDRYFAVVDLELPEPDLSPAAIQSLQPGHESTSLPSGFQTFLHEGDTLFYGAGNFFAYNGNSGFIVIAPPEGAKLRELPQEAEATPSGYSMPEFSLTPATEFGKPVFVIGEPTSKPTLLQE